MEKNYRIVIADNDSYSASSLADYLKNKEKFEINGIALDGVNLLSLVKTYQPDIVIADILLAKEDGLSIIRKIRTENSLKQPIIIVYSTLSSPMAINAAMEVKADYFIIKPQSFETIYNTINELVGAGRVNKIQITKECDEVSSSDDLEDIITRYLHNFGVPASVKGYKYLRSAILLAINDEESLEHVTKNIYPEIAKQYNSTATRVERAIRHSIESAWKRGRPEYLNSIFGNTILDTKPTNSEFIATLSDKIRLQMKCCVA